MSFVDEEFFEDEGSDAADQPPKRRSSRSGGSGDGGGGRGGSGGSPLQQRGVRMAIVAGIVVIGLLIIITSIRGCRRDQLVDSYKKYLTGVNAIADDSTALGNDLRAVLDNKDFKTAPQVRQSLTDLAARADELVQRTDRLSPPDAIKAPQRTLVTAMEYRRDALRELPDAIDAAVKGTDIANKLTTITAPLQALAASDVIYKRSFVGPTEQALQKDRIKDVSIKDSAIFPGNQYDMTSQSGARSILSSLSQVRPSSGSDPQSGETSGKHGLGLVKVVAKSGTTETQLARDTTTQIPGTGTVFQVTVENGGDFNETNITVEMTYTTPLDSQGTKSTKLIPAIAPGADEQKTVSFDAPNPPYFGKPSEITIDVKPVQGETLTDNNKATYSVEFQN